MRWLAGIFDPNGRTDSSRLVTALEPHAASIAERGPLTVAYSGARACPGRTLCLLDGYLDNAPALAAGLGAPMPSSPEALLVACWRRWGSDLLARLRGDFALLIWDGEWHEGLLARDQLGVRSLFVRDVGGVLYFANEIRYLLAMLPQRPPPDPVGVAHWVSGCGRAGSGTLYDGVRRLAPGGVLELGPSAPRARRYWAPRFHEPSQASATDVALQVREAVSAAVARRISPSGVTGVLMSGGLDSSAVAACASTLAPGSVAAYSGVFPDHPAVDESALIERLRCSLGLDGVDAEVAAGGLLASALESQAAWSAPLVGWGEFWALPLMREAAAGGVKIMLGGDGGDELFEVRAHLVSDRVRAGHPREALRLVSRLPGAGYGPTLSEVVKVTGNLALVGALPHRLHRLVARPSAHRAYPSWLAPQSLSHLLEFDDPLAWKRLDAPRWWAHAAHALTRGVEELGVFESLRRTAMLAGVDARHPLFDLDLIELVLAASPLSSFDPRADRPVLRASMAGLVPDDVRLRNRKALFDSLILDSLMGSDGAAVRAILSDPRAELASFVDLHAVRHSLLDGHGGSPATFASAQYLWRLVTAELWLREQAGRHGDLLSRGVKLSRPRVNLRPVTVQRPSAVLV
jgi:asparagine synthase (glutamine-hydrolysing)